MRCNPKIWLRESQHDSRNPTINIWIMSVTVIIPSIKAFHCAPQDFIRAHLITLIRAKYAKREIYVRYDKRHVIKKSSSNI